MRNRICDIIIPVGNRLRRTKRCLDSIVYRTDIRYRLILIDNASGKPTQKFLERFKKVAPCRVTLIRNEKNLSSAKTVNQGIEISESRYVCVLDDGAVVFPGWLEKMVEVAESREEIGIVNPSSNQLGFQKPWHVSWHSFAEKIAASEKGRVDKIPAPKRFCMLVKRAVIERVGGWSENDVASAPHEDWDYSRRAAEAGFICAHAREAFVYHRKSASIPAFFEVFIGALI